MKEYGMGKVFRKDLRSKPKRKHHKVMTEPKTNHQLIMPKVGHRIILMGGTGAEVLTTPERKNERWEMKVLIPHQGVCMQSTAIYNKKSFKWELLQGQE